MNFDFLNGADKLENLKRCCDDAEEFVNSKPYLACSCARQANEFVINYIYKNYVDNTETSKTPYEKLSDPNFTEIINGEDLLCKMHIVRKLGNLALHEGEVTKQDALDALKALHYVVGEFAYNIGIINEYDKFINPTIVSNTEYSFNNKSAFVNEPGFEYNFDSSYFQAPKMRDTRFVASDSRENDKENRDLFVKSSLREAGWKISTVDNQLMPSLACMNVKIDNGETIDIAFTGKDNKPLAIVETFEPGEDFVEARNRVIHKAEQLEQKFGYKPIAYYTDNYHFYCIDQLGYPPRKVFDFHSLEEMELLIQRRNFRKDISNPIINPEITNRPYQEEAIKSVCKALSSNRRRSLIVMATGTGKTRVAISLSDILLKNNWVKNILFLADRTSLVRQAKRNFAKLLPNVPTSEYTGENADRDPNARIIFSTYQTMINLISDDTREFSIGRFDLIIVDEAHRSIFKKYGALFEYFDSLMIGLTATPRSEENKNTYDIFGLQNGMPDYAYELKQAVEDKYLVGFFVNERISSLMKRNIKYDELSNEDKEKLESIFEEESEIDLTKHDMRQKIVNTKTIDIMLADLLKAGLKVNGGDKIGKTIIFAENHFQATQIVERYKKVYANGEDDFCALIDSTVDERYSLLDKFSEKESNPQIAVSVDMLDTGVDVPEILNLVFYKPVKSKIKFLQMIGRGTRTCSDLLGPGEDKKAFCIFDYFDNFNYFDEHYTWDISTELLKGLNSKSQSQSIYQQKLGVLKRLEDEINPSDFDKKYRDELINEFVSIMNSLSTDDIRVQNNMDYVNKYRSISIWKDLTALNIDIINDKIFPLFQSIPGNVKEKAFDLIMYKVEHLHQNNNVEGRLLNYTFEKEKAVMNRMVKALEKITTIPEITNNISLIRDLTDLNIVLNDFSIEKCEDIRIKLRHLMNYIPDDRVYYTICVDDRLDFSVQDDPLKDEKSYEEKVSEFLSIDNDVTLNKIRNLDMLDDQEKENLNKKFKEEFGNETDFVKWSNGMPLLVRIRQLIGFTNDAVNIKFGSFYNTDILNEKQYEFVTNVISYARTNGDITFIDLQKVSPFNNIDVVELFDDKINFVKDLINGLHKPVGD